MVVAVVAVRVMQMAIDEIAGVIAMRDGRVAAVWPVHVVGRVAATGVGGRAGVGVRRADGDRVLVDMVAMGVMQVA
ncbi:hypothetical protein, partial [Rubrimonas sp.]|uniref:hypothetical protein n=1 Tax=Rubrimonas sp. TaxID=2036015 RepID=UPI002FDE29EA